MQRIRAVSRFLGFREGVTLEIKEGQEHYEDALTYSGDGVGDGYNLGYGNFLGGGNGKGEGRGFGCGHGSDYQYGFAWGDGRGQGPEGFDGDGESPA